MEAPPRFAIIDEETAARRQAEDAWRREHAGVGRIAFMVAAGAQAYVPPPPILVGALSVFVGGELLPRFDGGELQRRRSLGYWGQVGGGFGPGVGVHRHMFAVTGSGGPRDRVFYQYGGGFVQYFPGTRSAGGTVGVQAGLRLGTPGDRLAVLLGIPISVDILASGDARGSVGVMVGFTNL